MAQVRKIQDTIRKLRSGRMKSLPSLPTKRAAHASPNGIVIPTYPEYRHGGGVTMREGVCSRGFGPRPPAGGVGTAANGCAGAGGGEREKAAPPGQAPAADRK